jgi:hypothetical protein
MAAWTPEEDATIRARAKTHSAAQIAALLPGRSRASVTGRAWRLGESLSKDDATRRALEHPGRARVRRTARPPVPPCEAPDAWPSAPPHARRAALAVSPRLAPLEALRAGECRWPYGEDDLRFCAHPTFGKGPYCAAHRGLAYVADTGVYDPDALADEIARRETRVRQAV